MFHLNICNIKCMNYTSKYKPNKYKTTIIIIININNYKIIKITIITVKIKWWVCVTTNNICQPYCIIVSYNTKASKQETKQWFQNKQNINQKKEGLLARKTLCLQHRETKLQKTFHIFATKSTLALVLWIMFDHSNQRPKKAQIVSIILSGIWARKNGFGDFAPGTQVLWYHTFAKPLQTASKLFLWAIHTVTNYLCK